MKREQVHLDWWELNTKPLSVIQKGIVLVEGLWFVPKSTFPEDLLWELEEIITEHRFHIAAELVLGYRIQRAHYEHILRRLILQEALKASGAKELFFSDIPYTNRPRWDICLPQLATIGVANHLTELYDVVGFLTDAERVLWLQEKWSIEHEYGYEASLFQRNNTQFDWSSYEVEDLKSKYFEYYWDRDILLREHFDKRGDQNVFEYPQKIIGYVTAIASALFKPAPVSWPLTMPPDS